MIDVFTLSTADALPDVRLLADSVRRFVPSSRFHWFVPEPMPHGLGEAIDEGIALHPIDRPSGARAAPRPTDAARHLIGNGSARVAYFRPGVVLFSPIPELLDRDDDIVLVPTLVEPAAPDDPHPRHELRALRSGVYSTACFSVAATGTGRRFLTWWDDRAHGRQVPVEEADAAWPWLTLAPAYFAGVAVVRSPRLGVGLANVHERIVQGSFETGFTVNGEPLGFVDFTGLAGSPAAAAPGGDRDPGAMPALVAWFACRRELERRPARVPA